MCLVFRIVDDVFEEQRPRLFSLAYRMLGSAVDAEDVVQDAWLRWAQASDVREPAGFLTTVVTRLCLDVLKSARVRRETYVGPWLPEPVLTTELGPLETVEQREQVSLGALTLLERLTPAERAVCVLRDAFSYPYGEIAAVVGLGEAYCRQLHRRARARLAQDAPPRFDVPAEKHLELGAAVFAAAMAGDVGALEALLAQDVVLVSDGGGQASAARRPVVSRDHVARFLVGICAKTAGPIEGDIADLNGAPALLGRVSGELTTVVVAESDGAQVRRLLLVVNPEKLERLAAAVTTEAASSS
jgi:RNA polymerase sigma-70 factor (TIGR02957 family)